jgi:very-short-patch-repair endonuclease
MGRVAAAIAVRHHGIVTREQLLAAGGTSRVVERLVRQGHFHRLFPAVFSVVPPALLTDEGRWLAAVLGCGPNSALSHYAAGQLAWIVARSESYGVHVSARDRVRHRLPGVIVHRPRVLPESDVTSRLGIRTTTCSRTVWDIANVGTPGETRKAFNQADKRDRLDRTRLRELLEQMPRRRGSGVIRRLLQSGSVPLWRTRSRLEEIATELCAEEKLPMPSINVPLLGYEVDLLWEDERFVVEADGGDHLNTDQRDADNLRDAILARAGYLIRRYSWWAMQRPREVAEEIRAILIERRGLSPIGSPEPA